MKRRTSDLREWWGRCHWQENSETKTVSPCHRRTWKNIFSFWIFMNIFSSMQTQDGFLWTFLALWKHNIKRIWRLSPNNQFAKWKERNASMTHIYMIWRYFLFMEYIQPLEMCKKERQGNCSLSGACSVVQDRRKGRKRNRRRRREDRRRKTWKRRRRR